MAIAAQRRRAGRLEKLYPVDRLGNHPPLTDEDVVALVDRSAAGQTWTEQETALMIRQCPYTKGNLIIRASQGAVSIKRYLGVDLASV